MKVIIKIFLVIMICYFGLILFMINNDNRNYDKIFNDIKDNCQIENIDYLNRYDDYYIVLDDEYLYLINNEYKIISRLDNSLICENINNYSIIYKDERFMYMSDKIEDGFLIYMYYDIYSYELIDEVIIGG